MQIDLTQTHDVVGAFKSIDWSEIRKKYTDAGTQYCFEVFNTPELFNYEIKLACFRHLRDLQRQNTNEFPYHYDMDKANHLLKFAAICPNVDTGEPTKLMSWQKFIFCQLFGWRDKEGHKRYTRGIVSVSRGQGKTYLMAVLMAYSYLIESLGLNNQDYLVASINFKQTGKLYGYINTMLHRVIEIEPFKTLAEEVDLRIQSDQVIQKKTNNILRAISFESGQFDSFHFTTAVVDEIGEVKTRDKSSKIISGQIKVPNHQFIQISTAYPDPTVPFHADEKMIVQAMEQDYLRDTDTYLGLIWCQDSLNETYKPETWIKSNPLLGLDSQKDVLMKGLSDKRDNDLLTGEIADFQNKNLNMWLKQSTASYLNLKDVEQSIIDNFDIRGKKCYIGADFSVDSDNTALAFIFPYIDERNGMQKWHLLQHSWIPWQRAGSIEAKSKQDGLNYQELEKEGFCTITGSDVGIINVDQVYRWLMNFVDENQLDVLFFGYDRYGSFKVKDLTESINANTSWMIQDIRQTTSELSDPTKFLQEKFILGQITRFDDKIMEKALLNAVVKSDKIGIQVDKDKASLKIDVVDAIIDGLYQGMYHFEDYSPVNDKSQQVDRMTEEQVKAWFENPNSGLLGGENK